MPTAIAAAFAGFPTPVRRRLLEVRRLIFETAGRTEGVGALTETLKWGEPGYLTEATGSGSTIRLGWLKSSDSECAVLFNCRTSLIGTFRTHFRDTFRYDKNRALLLKTDGRLPRAPLAMCLAMALTYHRRNAAARD